MAASYNPVAEGYRAEVRALDEFVQAELQTHHTTHLTKLSTFIRRYLSPLAVGDLFRHRTLPSLLEMHRVPRIAALVLDMRGFVRQIDRSEREQHVDDMARLLHDLFAQIIEFAFSNRGLASEFAGDSAVVIFGFPHAELTGAEPDEDEDSRLAIRRAVNTAMRIHELTTRLSSNGPRLEIGMGIAAGGPAWIGDITRHGAPLPEAQRWRDELTTISSVINMAARAEEVSKQHGDGPSLPEPLAATPDAPMIVVDQQVRDALVALQGGPGSTGGPLAVHDLGWLPMPGMGREEHLYQLLHVDGGLLECAVPIRDADRALVDWLCNYLDGADERDVVTKVQRSLSEVGHIVAASAEPNEEAIFERIVSTFHAERATLYQVDPDTEELVVVISRGPDPFPAGKRLPMDGIAGQVARTGQSYDSTDLHEDPTWLTPGKPGFEPEFYTDIRSMICVPLKTGDQVLGVVQVMDPGTGAFRAGDLAALEAFAALATVAVRVRQEALDRQRQAVATSTLDNLGVLTGMLTHNLTNKITMIEARARLNLPEDDPARRWIVTAAEEALDMMESARQPAAGGLPTTLDMRPWLLSALTALREELLGEGRRLDGLPGVELSWTTADRPLVVSLPASDLEFILRNLVENAIRAIDGRGGARRGRVHVELSPVEEQARAWSRLVVSDDGKGIPPEHLEHIFQPLFTTRPEGTLGGFGFGLYYVKLLVDKFGGDIAVHSEAGDGARFTIRFPLVASGARSG
ncbi:MAG TPA: ATP-binding protein [Actinomycetes bacterium]|nr:ATP-binding protein [Actinomycetes bacterium]